MGIKTIALKIGIVWAGIFLLAGCAQNQGLKHSIKPDQYSIEIARLEAVIVQKPQSSEGWQAHYLLAQLYIDHKNPRRNTKKGLDNLEIYLRHISTFTNDQELQNWLTALDEIKTQSQNNRIEWLSAELEESRQASLDLQEENGRLEEYNAAMNRKIDMLEILDHKVEEKRKSYDTE
jgi:hypothetical protein